MHTNEASVSLVKENSPYTGDDDTNTQALQKAPITHEEMRKLLENDEFLTKWKNNFMANLDNQSLSGELVKPFMFLLRTRPYANVPVVLVGAGPSLDKNINILKKYQNNAIILCADVIVYKLLEEGITPDFVISIDPSEMLERFWGDLQTHNLTLICPTTIHPKSLAAWKGRVFFYNQADIPQSPKGKLLSKLGKYTKGFGTIFNQFFVGGTMLQISTIFSPSNIFLMGYDFGYSDGKAYCDGFLDRKIVDIEHAPGTPEHKAAIESMKAQEPIGDTTMKGHDQEIATTRTLLLYKKTALQLINMFNLPVVNTTEGGLLVETPTQTLENAFINSAPNPITKKDTFKLVKRKRKKKK